MEGRGSPQWCAHTAPPGRSPASVKPTPSRCTTPKNCTTREVAYRRSAALPWNIRVAEQAAPARRRVHRRIRRPCGSETITRSRRAATCPDLRVVTCRMRQPCRPDTAGATTSQKRRPKASPGLSMPTKDTSSTHARSRHPHCSDSATAACRNGDGQGCQDRAALRSGAVGHSAASRGCSSPEGGRTPNSGGGRVSGSPRSGCGASQWSPSRLRPPPTLLQSGAAWPSSARNHATGCAGGCREPASSPGSVGTRAPPQGSGPRGPNDKPRRPKPQPGASQPAAPSEALFAASAETLQAAAQ